MTYSQNRVTHLPRFPDSVLNPAKKRSTRVRILAGLVVVALIVAVATFVPFDFESDSGSYRISTVSTEELEQAYTNVAAIEPIAQAEVSFPVSGTVETVEVAVGDEVIVGDTLATLDTETLEEALRVSEAELAQADLVLSIALDGDDPSSITGGAVGVSADEGANVVLAVYDPEETPNFQLAASNDEVTTAQQAVLAAQQAVDEAMTQASAALDSAAFICAAVDEETIDACRTALDEVSSAQQTVSDAQAELAAAAAALDDLLEQWAQELEDQSSTTTTTVPDDTTTTTTPGDGTSTMPSTPDTTAPTTPGTVPDGGGAPDGGQIPDGGGSAGGGFASGGATQVTESPSSEDLIAYQSAVDAAALQVEVAEQALAQASIVSPVSGTVTAVEIAPGDEVTGSADTQTIVVEGEAGYEATLMVSVTDIADIELGQTASLLPDGSSASVIGEIVRISAVPAASTTTYLVTVALEDASQSVGNGNIGDIEIITGQTDSVLAVPSSAVSLEGTTYSVTVVNEDETVSTIEVEIGVVGGTWVEVTSGDLSAGQSVVIADLDEGLPGSATEVTETDGFTDDGGFELPAGGGFQLPSGGQFPVPGG